MRHTTKQMVNISKDEAIQIMSAIKTITEIFRQADYVAVGKFMASTSDLRKNAEFLQDFSIALDEELDKYTGVDIEIAEEDM